MGARVSRIGFWEIGPPKVQDSIDSWDPNLRQNVFMSCAIFVGFQLATDRWARPPGIGFWGNWPPKSPGFGRFVVSQLKTKCLHVFGDFFVGFQLVTVRRVRPSRIRVVRVFVCVVRVVRVVRVRPVVRVLRVVFVLWLS